MCCDSNYYLISGYGRGTMYIRLPEWEPGRMCVCTATASIKCLYKYDEKERKKYYVYVMVMRARDDD